MHHRLLHFLVGLAAICAFLQAPAAEQPKLFRAGAHAIDVTPQKFPALIIGGFLEATSTSVTDPLHARCLVLDDGATRLALVVVDSCMLPRELLDEAKDLARQRTGIPTDRILISATHTHTAPAAMGGLGCRLDTNYAGTLPPKLAEGIELAARNLAPARIGWAVTDDAEHTHTRRWIYRPDKMLTDPFGERTVRANMHPGYKNPDALGPSGPADPGLSVLSVQGKDGRPIAVLANYSMHYFGATAVSADYFGRFASKIKGLVGATDDAPAFVGIMSQGTSGDQMWMDYGQAPKNFTLESYSEAVSQAAFAAYKTIEYRDWVPLAMAETKLPLHRRTPDEKRLAWAREIVAKMGDAPTARNLQEVYALEAIYLHEEPRRELKLQAVRIGDLGITAIPNEVYAITGLKLKRFSPLQPTFNIELANGGEGYIPPPEQHHLGGYTTWPARTAALEPGAEPKIVEALLELLEKVSGKPRRRVVEFNGPAAETILRSKPSAYWRLGEMAGAAARDATGNGRAARFSGGVAFYLEGPATEAFCGTKGQPARRGGPREGPGSGPVQDPGEMNRCVHLVGGTLEADLPPFRRDYSIELWFWNGLPNTARGVTGFLLETDAGDRVFLGGTNGSPGKLTYAHSSEGLNATITGPTTLAPKSWHHIVLVREGKRVAVFLDGNPSPELGLNSNLIRTSVSTRILVGGTRDQLANFEGKIDEVAVYHRALTREEITRHFQSSGLKPPQGAQKTKPDTHGPYAKAVLDLKPLGYWRQSEIDPVRRLGADASGNQNTATYEEQIEFAAAGPDSAGFSGEGVKNLCTEFAGGRMACNPAGLGAVYSVVLWFRNELPNQARPVTAYLFSRGRNGAGGAPGDHLGIGGTHQPSTTGRLFFFNGNELNQVLGGNTLIEPQTWNQAVLVREGTQVRVYLNGNATPEISGEAPIGHPAGVTEVFFGGRNDDFANLEGRLDEVALFNRALTPVEISSLYLKSGLPPKPLAGARASPPPARFEAPPKSPQDSLRAWRVREGFQIELAAAEPLVESPVAIDWGPDGRLWVVEMFDYPMGLDGKMKPGGRVRILEDTNGDGRYDKSTLFLDGLKFPNGIITWRNGAIITAAPDILFAADTDGDGVADQREVLYTGFKEGNLQLRINGVRWGFDQWLYCANGWSGGIARSIKNGKSVDLSGRDLRIRPDEGLLEPECGVSQFGRNRNDWGDWFGVNNSYPLWHYALADRYLRRNPHTALADPIVQLMLPANPKIFPARPPEKRFHSFEQSGRFTSACATMIYQDRLLFPPGADEHVFVCEPFHNLVHHELLAENGVSFAARRDGAELESEFLASEDRWTRPVMARTGPDGALWIVDMYRYMIEHPEWLPPEGKTEMEPFYRAGADRGRIYRVWPKNKSPAPIPNLTLLGRSELVLALESSNGWVRDKAQQMLLWRADQQAGPALERLAVTSPSPQTRLQALWTLDGLGLLRPEQVARAAADPSAAVRRQAVRLSEGFSKTTPGLLDALADRVGDDPKVRLQLACSLGEWEDPRAGQLLARLAIDNHNLQDRHLVGAILSSVLPHLSVFTQAIAEAGDPAFNAFNNSLLQIGLGTQRRDVLARCLDRVLSPRDERFSASQVEGFALFLDALGRRQTSIPSLMETADALTTTLNKTPALFAFARQTARAPAAAPAELLAATRLLGREESSRASDLDLLERLVAPSQPSEVQLAAIRALAATGDASVPGRLCDRSGGCGPEVLPALVEELMRREPWTIELLERIQNGAQFTFDPAQRSRLLKHSSEKIRTLAKSVLQSPPNTDRAAVIEQFGEALSLAGNGQKGAGLFHKLCASCHRVEDIGRDIGPNLRSTSGHSPEKMLVSILDPSREVEPRFLAYSCTLLNGEEVYGLISSESGSSITFSFADGTRRTILRSEVKTLRSTQLSLMPEGLEAGLTPQDLADLIAFVRPREPTAPNRP